MTNSENKLPEKNKEAVALGKLRWQGVPDEKRKAISRALHRAKKAKKKAEKLSTG